MPVTRGTMRRLRRLVADLAAAVDDVDRSLIRSYATAWDTVVDQLADALYDLAERGELTQTQVLRSSRIASALAAIARQLDGLAAEAAVVITGALGRVTSFAVVAQAEIAATQLPAAGAGFQFAEVNEDAVASVIARAAGNITARTRPLAEAGQVAVRRALTEGVAASDNPTKVARNMVRLARAGGVDLPAARASAVARTELLDASREAAQAWETANASTLAGWRWHSSLSETTCPSCFAMHGQTFPLSEPGPHDHVNGRCTRLTVTKSWADLGFEGLTEPGDDYPDAEATFRAFPRDKQLRIMGPARLKALDDGAPWSSLTYTKANLDWRPSQQVTPVRDLVRA